MAAWELGFDCGLKALSLRSPVVCRAMRSNKSNNGVALAQKYSMGSYRKLQERKVVKFGGQTKNLPVFSLVGGPG